MIESLGELDLLQEPPAGACASKFHPEHLDGDHTRKNKVLGLKNDTRSAPSNFSDETVSIRERGLENL